MATERLLSEISSGDLPRIDLGNFKWQPVDTHFARLATTTPGSGPYSNGAFTPAGGPQAPLAKNFRDPQDIKAEGTLRTPFPLNLLEGRNFAGKGYNTIWRPRSQAPSSANDQPDTQNPGGQGSDILELNLTAETTTFSQSLGNVPNRGFGSQKNLILNGISYVQRVGAFENKDSGKDDGKPVGIHFEPGIFMFVPESTSPKQAATLNRMASIPHGTTINAQGKAPTAMQSRSPDLENDFPVINILPFEKGSPKDIFKQGGPKGFFKANEFKRPASKGAIGSDRLPSDDLTLFSNNGTITEEVLADPNQLLRDAIKGQNIEEFVSFELTTLAPKSNDLVGGGTSNIGFLVGDPNVANSENSNAFSVTVRYWIETVSTTLSIKAKQSEPQIRQMISDTGIPGPTFIIPATDKLDIPNDFTKKVSWTQIQYSQNVLLNFNTLSWPHVSVATLGDVSTIPIKLA